MHRVLDDAARIASRLGDGDDLSEFEVVIEMSRVYYVWAKDEKDALASLDRAELASAATNIRITTVEEEDAGRSEDAG